jgi:hypothetical protein
MDCILSSRYIPFGWGRKKEGLRLRDEIMNGTTTYNQMGDEIDVFHCDVD